MKITICGSAEMKIINEFGYYKFYPESENELLFFSERFGVDLVRVGDYYTYPVLAALPDYSIQGAPYGGIAAKINYAGTPAEVFAQNGLKYDTENGKIISNDTVEPVGEQPTNYNWVVIGVPPAFAETADKRLITGYQGFMNVVKNYTIVFRWDYADI